MENLVGAADLDSLARGCMVRIQGLVAKPELNGSWALVLAPQTDSGRWPLAIAPQLPTETLTQLAVEPENLLPTPQTRDAMARAWNNLALAYKRSRCYTEAGQAYETSLAYALPPQQMRTLSNMIRLCTEMAGTGEATREETEVRMRHLMGRLFESATSLPELKGLDCTYGVDFVPGYASRVLYCGIVNSINGQPARTSFARLWIYDPAAGYEYATLVEVQPETGQSIPMSETAQRAIDEGVQGAMVTDLFN